MFTGIIEHLGTIDALELSASAGRLTVRAPSLVPALAVSNSIAVNGCCLTVVALGKDWFAADLSHETVQRTSFGGAKGAIRKGSRLNLEQPLSAGKELGGHLVQGHVDGTGLVTHLDPEEAGSSWQLGVEVPRDFARYIVPKGSITIDGISLTVANWNPRSRVIEMAVIPYTHEHTNLHDRKAGDAVNLEGDILGKYVARYLEARNESATSNITISNLIEQGFKFASIF